MKKNRIDFERIKRLIIIALVSDDYLMETLVLKGGNALSVAYELSSRASFDFYFDYVIETFSSMLDEDLQKPLG